MYDSFDVSSIEKLPSEIIGRTRQVEWIFSVSRMAVFGNELIWPRLSRVNCYVGDGKIEQRSRPPSLFAQISLLLNTGFMEELGLAGVGSVADVGLPDWVSNYTFL